MNRGFKHYFREGMSASASTLFSGKGKGHFRYLLYFFAELLGRITIILTPLFSLAKVRQGRVLRTEKRYDPASDFRRAGEPRPFWTLALCYLLEFCIILGGLLLVGIFTAMLAGLGFGIHVLIGDGELLPLFFSIPGMIVGVVYVITALLIFAPTPYVVAANEGIGVGDTLAVCLNTMKANGMGTLFLNVFLVTLIKVLYLGIFGAIGWFLADLFAYENYCFLVVTIVWIVGMLGYMTGAPILTLGMRAANQHLFEDILVDPVAVSKASKGIRITQCRGQKFGEHASGQALVAMFDDTEGSPADDITFEPKQKKRKKGAASAEEVYAPQAFAAQQPEAPVYEQPVEQPAAPVYEQPVEQPAAPVYEQPVEQPAAPVYEQPAEEPAEPVYEQPAAQPAAPVYEQPVEQPAAPVYEQPVEQPVAPVYGQPVEQPAEPVYEQPVEQPAEPVYEQPAEEPAEPVYEQPAEQPAEPVYEQPAVQPEESAAENAEHGKSEETAAEQAEKKPKPVLRRRRLK